MSHLDLNQTFIIEPAATSGDTGDCNTLNSNEIVNCSGDTKIFLNVDDISINKNLLPENPTIDVGTHLKDSGQ